ncbi:hypothetical protein AV540_16385 [Brevibacillus parabrevis]|uniref:hypothetical protein n=1 Tax=Brevibacillus parabrevis TaxID=54914 RepID=UPI0007AB295D|nr:hypothetical protein [Brevibacillus parabrevis]KZE48838.1 hypothetical protein AV540_16385 [Brevibacillus parabrevis]
MKWTYLVLIVVLMVGCSSKAVQTEAPAAEAPAAEATAKSIAEEKYNAMGSTGLTIAQFKDQLGHLKWEVHNEGSLLEITRATDELNKVRLDFFGPKDNLKKVSVSGFVHADSEEKNEATILYLLGTLNQAMPDISDDKVIEIVTNAISKFSEGDMEIVHVHRGNKITLSGIKDYGAIAIDIVNANNK